MTDGGVETEKNEAAALAQDEAAALGLAEL
jgi:hypothetical protein